MITMIALGLTLDTATNTPILVLQEKNKRTQNLSDIEPLKVFEPQSMEQGESEDAAQSDDEDKRVLPIWLGGAEAMALSMALNAIRPLRPLPHDLLQGMLDALQGRVLSVSLDDLRDGVFYATVEIERNGMVHRFDCRPSDGVALAVRRGLDIYVAESVMNTYDETRMNPGAAEEIRHPSDMMERIVLESGRSALATMTGGAPLATPPESHPATTEPNTQKKQRHKEVKTSASSVAGVQGGTADESELVDLLQRLEPATKRLM